MVCDIYNHPIGSIYHLYIANWVVICYLPPFRGTRNNPLNPWGKSGPGQAKGKGKEARVDGCHKGCLLPLLICVWGLVSWYNFRLPFMFVESVFPILKMGCLYEDRPFTMPNKNMLDVYLINLQGTNTYPTWGQGKSSTSKVPCEKGYVSSLKRYMFLFPFFCDFHVSVVVLFQVSYIGT